MQTATICRILFIRLCKSIVAFLFRSVSQITASETLNTSSSAVNFTQYGITVIQMRFKFDLRKSARLKSNPRRGIGFEEAKAIFGRPYYLDQRSDLPEQYRAIGWVGERLYSLIFEIREDEDGEFYHLVTLWKST